MIEKQNRNYFDWSGYDTNHPVFKGMEKQEIIDLKLLNKKVCVCVCVCVFDKINQFVDITWDVEFIFSIKYYLSLIFNNNTVRYIYIYIYIW